MRQANWIRAIGLGVVLAGTAFAPAANATTIVFPIPDLGPGPVTVGTSGNPGELVLENDSTGNEAFGNTTVTSIRLIPSCDAVGIGAACIPGFEDPGVFSISPTATGTDAGCNGHTFTVTTTDAATGEVTFTPSVPVVLDTVLGPTCTINFGFAVLKMPVHDSSPAAGVQTEQVGNSEATHANMTAGNAGAVSEITVLPAPQSPAANTTAAATATGQRAAALKRCKKKKSAKAKKKCRKKANKLPL